ATFLDPRVRTTTSVFVVPKRHSENPIIKEDISYEIINCF
ncbi:unnamed protein product, partial [marine sediment metagenome]